MGLIEEKFTLEYMIKLVKEAVGSKKEYSLPYKKDSVSNLRALLIGT
ncbi:hypothetical protein [Polaribacter sp. SA4-10]|nr:hypothetical protein [Polaribacter sp. SA4-10]